MEPLREIKPLILMKRIVFLFLVLAAFCGCCSVVHPKLAGRELASREADETVALIYTADNGNSHVYCSGVFVSNSVILTAAHCIYGVQEYTNSQHEDEEDYIPVAAKDIKVQFTMIKELTEVRKNPSSTHATTVKQLYRGEDLALLDITNPNSIPEHRIAKIADEAPRAGDKLSFMGHPDGFYWSYIEGVCSSIRSDLNMVPMLGPFIQVSAPVWKGNSGGCAYNEDEECVGIASFLNPNAPDQVFYVHTETVRGVLIGARIIKAKLNFQLQDPIL